jgi:uncharacterized membrane protein
MSDLVIIAYDSEAGAEGAYKKVQDLQRALVVELAGLALVRIDQEGKTKVETPASGQLIGLGAATGALFGAFIGLLFFIPVIGLVIGGAVGALISGLERTGMNASFRARVKNELPVGSSAVVIYATKITRDKFADALAPFGGTVIETSLSQADERQLASELATGH